MSIVDKLVSIRNVIDVLIFISINRRSTENERVGPIGDARWYFIRVIVTGNSRILYGIIDNVRKTTILNAKSFW